MSRFDKEAIQKLASDDPLVREQGLMVVWEALSLKFKLYFRRKTGNPQTAEDLLQRLFYKMSRRVAGGPLVFNNDNPEPYFTTAAASVVSTWNTSEAKQREAVERLVKAQSREQADQYAVEEALTEEALEQQQVTARLRALLLYVEGEWDRRLAVMHWGLGYRPGQIRSVMGWERQAVYNGVRQVKRKLMRLWPKADLVLKKPSRWEAQLAGTGTGGRMGLSHLNVRPRNIAPESLKELRADLGISDLEQLFREYFVLFRNEGIDGEDVAVGLEFTPWYGLRRALFEGASMSYLSYTIGFHRVREKGGWKEVMELRKQGESSSRLTNWYDEDEAGYRVTEWEFTPQSFTIRKPLTHDVIAFAFARPGSREEGVGLYRAYPPAGRVTSRIGARG